LTQLDVATLTSGTAAPAGSSRNGFGRNRSISTPERGISGATTQPPGGSPARRPGMPSVTSSEHDSELLLLRGRAPVGSAAACGPWLHGP